MPLKYGSLLKNGLFKDDYCAGKFTVQDKRKATEGISTFPKWDKGLTQKVCIKKTFDGVTVEGVTDFTPKGVNPSVQFNYNDWQLLAKQEGGDMFVEPQLKDTKAGAVMYGGVAKVVAGKEPTASMQASYAHKVNDLELIAGAKFAYEKSAVKPEFAALVKASEWDLSGKYDVTKKSLATHTNVTGPKMCGFSTTLGLLASFQNMSQFSTGGIALQLKQGYFTLKAKLEGASAAALKPSVALKIEHKPSADLKDKVEFTFAWEKDAAAHKFGVSAQLC